MKKRSIIVLTLLAGCFTNSFAQKGEKTLTVEVSNEWTQNKTDEPIVIDLNNLKAGFNIKSATVWEGNKEIPSQLDDLNGDARADELAFLIDMPAKSNKSFRIILSSEKSEKNSLRTAKKRSEGISFICYSAYIPRCDFRRDIFLFFRREG